MGGNTNMGPFGAIKALIDLVVVGNGIIDETSENNKKRNEARRNNQTYYDDNNFRPRLTSTNEKLLYTHNDFGDHIIEDKRGREVRNFQQEQRDKRYYEEINDKENLKLNGYLVRPRYPFDTSKIYGGNCHSKQVYYDTKTNKLVYKCELWGGVSDFTVIVDCYTMKFIRFYDEHSKSLAADIPKYDLALEKYIDSRYTKYDSLKIKY